MSDLLIVIQEWIKEENIGEIAFFHNQIVSMPSYEPKFKSIFPLNLDWLKSLTEPGEGSMLHNSLAQAKQPASLGKTFAALGIVESVSLFAFVFALLLS